MAETQSTRWFRPPRPHGHVIEDRSVTFLELFYDLVFVVLIAQIAHTLADHVSWTGLRDFVIVFALIWIAWLNGTLYHELHGGEDGRSRTYIFAQMSILALLSVFAAHAADDAGDGRNFAIVYTILLLVIAWQWFDVRRFDTPEWRRAAGRYVFGMLVIAAIVGASVFVDDPNTRLAFWAAAIIISLVGNLMLTVWGRTDEMMEAMRPTESLVERFGLFNIIVLGEVVVGVADGVSEAERTTITIVTAVLALWVGFSFWWNYYDFIGGRRPRLGQPSVAWLYLHLPLGIGVSAAGAGMVSLVEHAGDSRTPTGTAWLLGGSVATVAVAIALLTQVINPHPTRQLTPYLLAGAAVGSLVAAAARPAPWLFVILLWALMSMVWNESFARHLRSGTMITDGH